MWRRTLVFCCAAFLLAGFSYGQGPRGPKRPEGGERPGRPEARDGAEHRGRAKADKHGDKDHDSAMHEHKKPGSKAHHSQAKHAKHTKHRKHDSDAKKHAKHAPKHAPRYAGEPKPHRAAADHLSRRDQGRGDQVHGSMGPVAPMSHVDAMMKRLDRNHDEQLSRDELAGMMHLIMARGGHPGAFGPQRDMPHGQGFKGRSSIEGRQGFMGRPAPQQFMRHRFHPDVNAPMHQPPRGREQMNAGDDHHPEQPRPEARNHERGRPEARDGEHGRPEAREGEHGRPEAREHERGWPEARERDGGGPEVRDHGPHGPEARNIEGRAPESREEVKQDAE